MRYLLLKSEVLTAEDSDSTRTSYRGIESISQYRCCLFYGSRGYKLFYCNCGVVGRHWNLYDCGVSEGAGDCRSCQFLTAIFLVKLFENFLKL